LDKLINSCPQFLGNAMGLMTISALFFAELKRTRRKGDSMVKEITIATNWVPK
jgi:hypothetical protein